MMQGPEAVVAAIFIAAVGGTGLILAQAVAKRIARSPTGSAEIEAMKDELAQLRAEMDDMRAKVGDMDELHNRVDFAERVIGQMKNQAVLPPGGGH